MCIISMEMINTQKDFDSAKHLDLILIRCQNCNNNFSKTKNAINANIKKYGLEKACQFCSWKCRREKIKCLIEVKCRGCNQSKKIYKLHILSTGNFCSKSCKQKTLRTNIGQPMEFIDLSCYQCNNLFKLQKAEFNRGIRRKTKYHFCSKSCTTKYYNKNKTWSIKRSKMERYIEEQIKLLYPQLNLICNNRKILNGLELDFYFPELKFGIELNGNVHYEPIYGPDRLLEVKNCDSRKIIECYKLGIELAVIDTSKYPNFTEKSKNFYWNIVKELLDKIIPK